MRRVQFVIAIGLFAFSARAELVELGSVAPFPAPLETAAIEDEAPRGAPPGPSNAQLAAEAQRGDTAAMIRLGRNLETGRGGEFNEEGAAAWYRRAAGDNDPRGAYHLGRLYATGRGVPRNDGEAMAWYTRAAAGGVRPAVAGQAQLCFEGRAANCGRDDGLARVRAAMQGATADDLNNMAWQLSWQTTVIGPLLEEAHGMAVAAVAAAPDNGYFVGTLGWIELRRAYYDRAIELLQRERRLRADCDWSCDDRQADALHAAGRTGEARSLWTRALAAAPGALDRQIIQTKLRNTGSDAVARPQPPVRVLAPQFPPPPQPQAAPVAPVDPPTAVVPVGPGGRDVAERLRALRRLLDQGVISRQEHDAQRRRILSEI